MIMHFYCMLLSVAKLCPFSNFCCSVLSPVFSFFSSSRQSTVLLFSSFYLFHGLVTFTSVNQENLSLSLPTAQRPLLCVHFIYVFIVFLSFHLFLREVFKFQVKFGDFKFSFLFFLASFILRLYLQSHEKCHIAVSL